MSKSHLGSSISGRLICVKCTIPAYFTSEHNDESLISQMHSVGLDVSRSFRKSKLGIYPIEEPTPDGNPEPLIASLPLDIQRLPSRYKVIVVDSITDLVSYSPDRAVIGLFSSFKRLCNEGRTIILVANSYAFDEKMLIRLRALCDAHLSLRAEKQGGMLLRTVEVCKVRNAELNTANTVSFDVEAGVGMRISPISKVRA